MGSSGVVLHGLELVDFIDFVGVLGGSWRILGGFRLLTAGSRLFWMVLGWSQLVLGRLQGGCWWVYHVSGLFSVVLGLLRPVLCCSRWFWDSPNLLFMVLMWF